MKKTYHEKHYIHLGIGIDLCITMCKNIKKLINKLWHFLNLVQDKLDAKNWLKKVDTKMLSDDKQVVLNTFMKVYLLYRIPNRWKNL